MWIELNKPVIFSKRLVMTSDEAELGQFKFTIKRGLTTIETGSGLLITTDGRHFLRIGNDSYIAERKALRISTLTSTQERLQLDWKVHAEKGCSQVGLRRLGSDEAFVIKKYEDLRSMFLTQVRIETRGSTCTTPSLRVLGYLAFFWTYYENDRTSFG